jgi:hypothetical protein
VESLLKRAIPGGVLLLMGGFELDLGTQVLERSWGRNATQFSNPIPHPNWLDQIPPHNRLSPTFVV